MRLINFELEKNKILEEVRIEVPGDRALEKLKFARENFDWAIEGYRNSLAILSDTAYEERKHFLMELIQNADDADYGDEAPEIQFTITKEGIELYYNEIGFSIEDIISITDTGASTKKSKKNSSTSFIGEKGIGFKSVFALAESVEIQSGPWHFVLHKERCIIPIPLPLDAPLIGTKQKIKLSDEVIIDEIYNELKRYVSGEVETFLYLQKISRFVLLDERGDSNEKYEIEILPKNRLGDKLTLHVVNTGEEREFLLYSENITFSKELVAARWEKIGTSLGSVERRVIVAAMVNGSKEEQLGRLFCYLPTSVKLPIPIFMQVDGMTKADRERLHDPYKNEWNKFLLSKLPGVMSRAITYWSKAMKSPEIFQEFVPIVDGEDQLMQVFYATRRELIKHPWVKVMSETSVRKVPDEVVVVPPYLGIIFQAYPEIRLHFEKELGKFPLDVQWSLNHQLKQKLEKYNCEMVSTLDMLISLQGVTLPNDITRSKEKLKELYLFLVDILDMKFSKFKNPSDTYYNSVLNSMRNLKFYPIEGEGFSSLGNEGNVHFSTSKLEKAKEAVWDIRSIDFDYTNENQENGLTDGSSEVSRELATILKKLLTKLQVKELTEETILNDFIIPELSSTKILKSESRSEKFYRVFEFYKSKKILKREHGKILEHLSDIYLHNQDLKLRPLKEMLIPRAIRVSASENIYDGSDLKELYISQEVMEKVVQEKALFHQFLIDAGIKYKPIFHAVTQSFSDAYQFKQEDARRFDIWNKRIRNDFTLANKVVIERVFLDKIDSDLIEKGVVTKEFEKYLYEAWCVKFRGNEINDYSYYYKGKAFPGFFTITYIRQEKRALQLKETNWAGIDARKVPIKIFSGMLVSSLETFILPPIRNKQLHYLLDHLNGVVAEGKDYPHLSYDRLYLDSLGIREMVFEDLDNLWKLVDSYRFDDIIRLIIELYHHKLPYNSIQIMDKRQMKLVDIKDFRLGMGSNEDAPLIEKQYGELGTELGRLFNLAKEGTIDSFKGTIKNLLVHHKTDGNTIKRFLLLLQEWNGYSADEKKLMIDEFKSGVEEGKPPILILENRELYKNLEKNSVWCVFIPLDGIEIDIESSYRAAKEIGFVAPDNFGELVIINPTLLRNDEKEKSSEILNQYIQLLEEKEKIRLNQKLKIFGGTNKVLRQIVLADAAKRMVSTASIEYIIELPLLDEKNRRIVFCSSTRDYELIKHLLLMIEFAPRRNIERDLADIKKMEERKQVFNVSHTYSIEERAKNETSRLENSGEHERFRNKGLSVQGASQGSIHHPDTIKASAKISADHVKDISVTNTLHKAVENFKENLQGNMITTTEVISGWKLGPSPDEEVIIRQTLVEEITSSLNNGPEIYKKKLRNLTNKKTSFQGQILEKDEMLIDKDAIDSKAFLEDEYDCKCQVCGLQLIFESGKKWTSVYHIQDKKEGAWFYNRPFNILGLCPNCYTISMHGGHHDFSQLVLAAQDVIEGENFAEPVPEFNGDYYVVDVVLDNKPQKMKVSKIHMSYFVALIQTTEDEM